MKRAKEHEEQMNSFISKIEHLYHTENMEPEEIAENFFNENVG